MCARPKNEMEVLQKSAMITGVITGSIQQLSFILGVSPSNYTLPGIVFDASVGFDPHNLFGY